MPDLLHFLLDFPDKETAIGQGGLGPANQLCNDFLITAIKLVPLSFPVKVDQHGIMHFLGLANPFLMPRFDFIGLGFHTLGPALSCHELDK